MRPHIGGSAETRDDAEDADPVANVATGCTVIQEDANDVMTCRMMWNGRIAITVTNAVSGCI